MAIKPDSNFDLGQRLRIQILVGVFLAAALFFMPDAYAQTVDGLCEFAEFLRELATAGAVVALILFVLNSFFLKNNVVGDIIMYVIIGCVIMSVAPTIITLTGLTQQCSF